MTSRGPASSPVETIHPAVAAAFGALDDAAVRWCLLRGSPALDDTSPDLDVAVAPADLDRAVAALRALGFVSVPAPGDGHHRPLLRYDATEDRWIKLDLAGGLTFGRGPLMTADAEAVLARAERTDGVRRPAPDDRFWALLAHSLLDPRRLTPAHLEQLSTLARTSGPDGPLAAAFEARCPPDWDADRVLDRTRAGDGPALARLSRAIRRRWILDHPLAALGLATVGRLERGLRRLEAGRRRGLVVALLGPDGVGKSTLAARLGESFPLPTRRLYLGLYGGHRPRVARTRVPGLGLAARLGRLVRLRLVAAWNRARGRIVILDRHPADALIARSTAGPLDRLRRRLLATAGPVPDLTVILDAPPEVLLSRKADHPLERQLEQRRGYLELAGRLPGVVVVVDATPAAESVRQTVNGLLWSSLVERWHRDGSQRPRVARPSRRHIARISRAAMGPWELARARRRLPEILRGLPGLPEAAEGWRAQRAIRTAGLTILFVGPSGAPPAAAVKLAVGRQGRTAIRRWRAVQPRLATAIAGSEAEPLVPSLLGSGAIDRQLFVVEQARGGVRASQLDAATQLTLLPGAAAAIRRLHDVTAEERPAGQADLDRWVARRVRRIARLLPSSGSPDRAVALAWLEAELTEGLRNRPIRAGWIHGDFWAGNILVDERREICGIVDWDGARPCELALQDQLHLILYTRHALERRPLGEIVAERLGAPAWPDAEQRLLADPGLVGGTLSPREALLLYWIRFVAANLSRGHATVRTPRWLAANVESVVRCL